MIVEVFSLIFINSLTIMKREDNIIICLCKCMIMLRVLPEHVKGAGDETVNQYF